jgi:hypothetical protein
MEDCGAALRASAEQLEPVRFDLESGSRLDLADDRLQAQLTHLDGLPAARADEMVVMGGRLAGDVGVFARREVDTLDQSQVGQHLDRPEDGRPGNGTSAVPSPPHDILCREMAILLGDDFCHRSPGGRDAQTGTIQGAHDVSVAGSLNIGAAHPRILTQLRLSRN